MLGEMMAGLTGANQQDLEAQWSATLKDPAFQAGLLNFGVELMKPRWSGASALPDALSAGARGYAGVQEEQHNREQTERTRQDKLSEAEANRANRVETARIAADSRAEVQGMRNYAMLENTRAKHELKNQLTSGLTPQENARYRELVKTYRDSRMNDISRLGQPIDEAKLTQEASDHAWNIIMGQRVRGMGGPNGGDIPSANSANPSGSVSPGGPPRGANNSSANNASSVSAHKPTTAQVIERLKARGLWTNHPQQIQQLMEHVSDPDVLRSFLPTAPPTTSTMQGF